MLYCKYFGLWHPYNTLQEDYKWEYKTSATLAFENLDEPLSIRLVDRINVSITCDSALIEQKISNRLNQAKISCVIVTYTVKQTALYIEI